MIPVTTRIFRADGTATQTDYDEDDKMAPGSSKFIGTDPTRAHPKPETPEPNIFERTAFRWIKGVA